MSIKHSEIMRLVEPKQFAYDPRRGFELLFDENNFQVIKRTYTYITVFPNTFPNLLRSGMGIAFFVI